MRLYVAHMILLTDTQDGSSYFRLDCLLMTQCQSTGRAMFMESVHANEIAECLAASILKFRLCIWVPKIGVYSKGHILFCHGDAAVCRRPTTSVP